MPRKKPKTFIVNATLRGSDDETPSTYGPFKTELAARKFVIRLIKWETEETREEATPGGNYLTELGYDADDVDVALASLRDLKKVVWGVTIWWRRGEWCIDIDTLSLPDIPKHITSK